MAPRLDPNKLDHTLETEGSIRHHESGIKHLEAHYRFEDLKRLGIVPTWTTLYVWIKERGFPEGRKINARYRIWTTSEVQRWLDQAHAA